MTTYAGIDAGGTLIKIAYVDEDSEGENTAQRQAPTARQEGAEASAPSPKLLKFPTSRIEEAAVWIAAHLPPGTRIGCTGGQAERLRRLLPQHANFADVPEFEATAEGAVRILEAESRGSGGRASGGAAGEGASSGAAALDSSAPDSGAERFVLVNVGTGTSFYVIDGAERPRLGGIGLGGGTIVGLTGLLCGVRDYAEIARLAPLGDREAVDLTVGQIYAPAQPPIAGDLTAANFARPLPPEGGARPQDYAAAVIGMVAEIVTTVGVQHAKLHGARRVVYVGSSYEHNALLRELTVRFTAMLGSEAVIPEAGPYSGALGALYAAMRR